MKYTIKQASAVAKIKKFASVAKCVRYQRALNKFAFAYKCAEETAKSEKPEDDKKEKKPGFLDKVKGEMKAEYQYNVDHPIPSTMLGGAFGGSVGYGFDLLRALARQRQGKKYSVLPNVGALLGTGVGSVAGGAPWIIEQIKKDKKDAKKV